MIRGVFQVVFVFIFIFILPFVSGNFVCGQVLDPGNLSSSWLKVSVFYYENPGKTTNCSVSPEENKYCCDPLDIKEVSWRAGKVVGARILDLEHGLIAGPVNLTITGEGFDIFPRMNLQHIYTIHGPNTTLLFNTNRVFVNVSAVAPFTRINYRVVSSDGIVNGEVCPDCTHAEFFLENISYGAHELRLFFSNGSDVVVYSTNISLVQWASVERKISCPKCKGNILPADTNVNVSVKYSFSHPVVGQVGEGVPSSWLTNSAVLLDSEHEQFYFPIDASSIVINYTLKTPALILPQRYLFYSSFDSISLGNQSYLVLRWPWMKLFAFLSGSQSGVQMNPLMKKTFHDVSPSTPIVLYPMTDFISDIVIFPNASYDTVGVRFFTQVPKKANHDGYLFYLDTTIPSEGVSNVLLHFKVRKPKSGKFNLDTFSLYHFSDEWGEIELRVYKEDSQYVYLEGSAEDTGAFALVTKGGFLSFFSTFFGP